MQKKIKKVALSIGYIFKLCMGNTFKRKKWWLEISDWKFETNETQNITFEENWARWVKMAISDFQGF